LLRAILLLQLFATPPAQTAEELVHASIRDFDLGDYPRALEEAEQAYRLDPLPQILFNIGQCHRALKHWERASYFYRRYLAKVPDAPNRRAVEDRLVEVEYRLKTEQLPAPPQPAPQPPPKAAPTLDAPPAAPQPTLPAAPPPAVTAAPESPKSHSHLLGIGLVVGGVVAGAIAGYGQLEVQTYLADRGVARGPNDGSYTHLFGEQQSAQNWLWPSVILGVLGVAGVTAGAITW
jgi:tetratricopeptide (TPR) repeat protein